MRGLMEQHLGADWEIWLVLASAIALPGASYEQVLAARKRAVAIVREMGIDWTVDSVGELIDDARSRLWPRITGVWDDGLAR